MRRLLLATLIFAPIAAHAQAIAIYGTFSPAHLSNVQTGAVYTATQGYVNQTTSYWAPGFGGGVTFNVLPRGLIRVGLDLRGSSKPGTSGVDSALVGVKVAVHPPVLHIKPYGQVSLGYLDSRTINVTTAAGSTNSSNTVGGTFGNQYAAFEAMGGIDYPLLGPLDVRIFELGVGRGFGFTSTNPTFFTINSGLVLHF
jgi:hypothetical protein